MRRTPRGPDPVGDSRRIEHRRVIRGCIAYLPMGGWPRAFLAIGLVFVVTSTFTLAKCVRDQQEEGEIINRVDQARLEKLLADHDLFRVQGT
jgi:hypothetical protein